MDDRAGQPSEALNRLPAGDDLSGDDWIIEANDAVEGADPEWRPVWSTWEVEDDEESDRLEKEAVKAGKKLEMMPHSMEHCLALLMKVRPDRGEWDIFRFVNQKSGTIILAWVLK